MSSDPSSHIQSFYDAMCKAGSAPAAISDIMADGKDHTIQLEKDKKTQKRLSYCLTIFPEGGSYGNWTNHDDSVSGDWHSNKGKRSISKEERAAFEARLQADRAAKEAAREDGYAAAAEKAKTLWNSCQPATEHPYLTAKVIQPHSARLDGEDLIYAGYSNGKIQMYQRINPSGEKTYQYSAKKQGSYHPFTTAAEPKGVICIAEGIATAASIREATGLPVLAAWDTSNLAVVAQDMRNKYPQAIIVLCADNDCDKKKNGGIFFAEQAAGKVGGFTVWPEMDGKKCDWNDYAAVHGLEAVKEKILAAAVAGEGGGEVDSHEEIDSQLPPTDSIPMPEYDDRGAPTIGDDGNIDLTGDMGLPFKILGYNDELFYYFPFGMQQIVKWSAASHTINNFLQLAQLQDWKDWALRSSEERMSPKEIPLYAFDKMAKIAVSRGVFQEEDRVRGCGAWVDAGRVVLHCGDKLLVDGVLTPPKSLASHYVYVAAAQRFKHHAEPLSNAEANKLRKICEMPTWENPLSGPLLAGWLVIAPICAALEWRPHIWLTGEAGAGKSTVLNMIIKKVLQNISYNADGGTTESSIREGLGYDSRPIIYDEAEGKGNKFSLMDGVLALAKLASSGGNVGKRGQRRTMIRSSFCFSAINPPIKDFASETRISMMSLKKNTSLNSQKHFDALTDAINETLTSDYGRRLLARTVKYMPNLLANIKTFKKAATTVIKNARAADQVSAMLGGLYMLGSTEKISVEEAVKWISERDWTEHTAINQESDPERLLHYIGTSVVRVTGNSAVRDHTIGTLISSALGKSSEVGSDLAKETLKQYSIAVKNDGVVIGNNNRNIAKLLNDTDWGLNWNKTLGRLPSTVSVSKQYFGPTDNQRALRLPVKLFFEEEQVPMEEEVEIAF